MIKLNDIKVSVDYDDREIKKAVAKKLKINANDVQSIEVVRSSIDARFKNVRFSLGILAQAKGYDTQVIAEDAADLLDLIKIKAKNELRPVIVGAGPAGMFAALVLAQSGQCPILIERGQNIEKRKKKIEHFQTTGQLDTESNVCFGEGGAGTFSDGKLVTRVNDPLCNYVLNTFVEHGASNQILIDSRPHIGTDVLSEILIAIRKCIISLGGEVSFDEKMLDISIKNGKVKGILTNKRQIDTHDVILATGHGARDIYNLLNQKNIHLIAKGFALGVRIEHLREKIDKSIYGQYAGHKRLGAASYNLKGKFAKRNVYSFCMCPGGEVINASTELDGLCVNGMSYNARDGINSNAAIVVQMHPEDWGGTPMGGIEFQRKFEQMAFIKAGGDFSAPVQRFEDFQKNRLTKTYGEVMPSIKGKTAFVNLRHILGHEISHGIIDAINYWDNRINGFASGDAILTGVEGRTSSPIRVLRGDDLQSTGVRGLYPCGEGAGYAGGIMSAAVDGIKCALKIIEK